MDVDEHALDLTSGIVVRIAGDHGERINLYGWMNEVLDCLHSIEYKLEYLERINDKIATPEPSFYERMADLKARRSGQ